MQVSKRAKIDINNHNFDTLPIREYIVNEYAKSIEPDHFQEPIKYYLHKHPDVLFTDKVLNIDKLKYY